MRVRRPGQGRRRFGPEHVDGVLDAAIDAWSRRDHGPLRGAVDLLVEGPDVPPSRSGATNPGAAAGSPGAGSPGSDSSRAGVPGASSAGSDSSRAGVPGAGSAGVALVDEALDRRLLGAVGALWGKGWQPADLARVVGRDLGRAHADLAAATIVREATLYPPAAVPRRWQDQVDELIAPTRARRSPAAGPADERAARAQRVLRSVELLGLLALLPGVPKLGAAPGEATAGDGAAGTTAAGGDEDGEVDQRMLHRVRSLLAKAESTTFPDEAEALTAKAQELMARYAIDAALLAAGRGDGPDVGGRRLGVDDPYAAAKAMLLDAIASANRCRSVWTRAYGYATVFGDEGDVDAVELLYTSLLVQAARAMLADGTPAGAGRTAATRAGGASGGGGGRSGRTRSYRQSFLVAFAVRIGDRLAEAVAVATEAAAEEASVRRDALLPVLAGRQQAAEAACEAAFPEIRNTTVSANDWAGWHAGRQAAEAAQLDLHTPVTSRSTG